MIRMLWEGGVQSHRGRHYRVDHARIYDLPEQTPPILVSGFGPQATALAARIGDGFCTVKPTATRSSGFASRRGGEKLVAGGMKVCWGEDEAACRTTAHRLWPNEALPGELAQILPTPAHFEQACELVTEEHGRGGRPLRPRPRASARGVRALCARPGSTSSTSSRSERAGALLRGLRQRGPAALPGPAARAPACHRPGLNVGTLEGRSPRSLGVKGRSDKGKAQPQRPRRKKRSTRPAVRPDHFGGPGAGSGDV